jgi:hypothetical protein
MTAVCLTFIFVKSRITDLMLAITNRLERKLSTVKHLLVISILDSIVIDFTDKQFEYKPSGVIAIKLVEALK